MHRGCAFVTFWSGADAERAQEALHDKFTFPGARRAAQVKPAEPTGRCTSRFIVICWRSCLLRILIPGHSFFYSSRKQVIHWHVIKKSK